MTHYLRFSSEDEAKTVMSDYFGEDWITASLTHALDPVGILYNDDAVIGEDMTVLVDPTTKDGFHVNFIGELPVGAVEYVIHPNSPSRIFAV